MTFKVKGCCCLSLYSAGVLIAVLDILYSIKELSQYMFLTLELHAIKSDYDSRINQKQDAIIEFRKVSTILFVEYYFGLALILFNIVTCVLIFVGIKKNSPKMLLPWLITKAIGFIIVCPTVFYLMIQGYSAFEEKPELIIIPIIVALVIGISIWAWITIYSLYVHMRTLILFPEGKANSNGNGYVVFSSPGIIQPTSQIC